MSGEAIQCNCENLRCPHHGGNGDMKAWKVCPNSVEEGEGAVALYIGKICDECTKHMPKEYLRPPHGTGKG